MEIDLKKILDDEYPFAKKPLFLSYFGGILKSKYNVPTDGLFNRLKNIPGYAVVHPEGKKEKAAVVTDSDRDEISAKLSEPKTTASSADLKFLNSLQRNLLIAFCRKEKTTDHMYIQGRPPFHFFDTMENNADIEIKNSYLLDIFLPFDLSKLSQENATLLKDNICRWSEEEKNDLGLFQAGFAYKGNAKSSLLEQVIAAIPPNRRSSFSIPLDIIECLMKN